MAGCDRSHSLHVAFEATQQAHPRGPSLPLPLPLPCCSPHLHGHHCCLGQLQMPQKQLHQRAGLRPGLLRLTHAPYGPWHAC